MKHMTATFYLTLAAIISLVGCTTMAPTYSRPTVPVPASWPNGPSYQTETVKPLEKPLADITWQDFFVDRQLQGLIKLALENNRNLRIAALNIERSQAQYRIQRANLVPEIDAAATGSNQWAIGGSRTRSGKAMLLINPHQPYYGFGQFYEAHLRSGEGWNFTGATDSDGSD